MLFYRTGPYQTFHRGAKKQEINNGQVRTKDTDGQLFKDATCRVFTSRLLAKTDTRAHVFTFSQESEKVLLPHLVYLYGICLGEMCIH